MHARSPRPILKRQDVRMLACGALPTDFSGTGGYEEYECAKCPGLGLWLGRLGIATTTSSHAFIWRIRVFKLAKLLLSSRIRVGSKCAQELRVRARMMSS